MTLFLRARQRMNREEEGGARDRRHILVHDKNKDDMVSTSMRGRMSRQEENRKRSFIPSKGRQRKLRSAPSPAPVYNFGHLNLNPGQPSSNPTYSPSSLPSPSPTRIPSLKAPAQPPPQGRHGRFVTVDQKHVMLTGILMFCFALGMITALLAFRKRGYLRNDPRSCCLKQHQEPRHHQGPRRDPWGRFLTRTLSAAATRSSSVHVSDPHPQKEPSHHELAWPQEDFVVMVELFNGGAAEDIIDGTLPVTPSSRMTHHDWPEQHPSKLVKERYIHPAASTTLTPPPLTEIVCSITRGGGRSRCGTRDHEDGGGGDDDDGGSSSSGYDDHDQDTEDPSLSVSFYDDGEEEEDVSSLPSWDHEDGLIADGTQARTPAVTVAAPTFHVEVDDAFREHEQVSL